MYPEFDAYVSFYHYWNKLQEIGPIPCTYSREAIDYALEQYDGKNITKIKVRLE